MTVRLCPAQQHGYDKLRRLLPLGNVFALSARNGTGRTTVLRRLHAEAGGAWLNMADLTAAMRQRDPLSLEETFERLALDALSSHDLLVVDDLHLLSAVVDSDSNYLYPRKGLLDAPLT